MSHDAIVRALERELQRNNERFVIARLGSMEEALADVGLLADKDLLRLYNSVREHLVARWGDESIGYATLQRLLDGGWAWVSNRGVTFHKVKGSPRSGFEAKCGKRFFATSRQIREGRVDFENLCVGCSEP